MQVNGGVVSFLGCDLDDNSADEAGGGLFLAGGSTLLANQTVLRRNHAPLGAAVRVEGEATLAYGLPAPHGYWVPEPFLCGPDEPRCDYWRNPLLRNRTVSGFIQTGQRFASAGIEEAPTA
jgi:hypothetical protein